MSRSGYSDDYGRDNQWDLIRWRGAVASAIRGKHGQKFLRELLDALDAMPVKRLVAHEWIKDGEACALGVIGQARGIGADLENLDPDDDAAVLYAADKLGIANALAKEIVYMNDEGLDWSIRPYGFIGPVDRQAERWRKMRKWVAAQIKPEPTA